MTAPVPQLSKKWRLDVNTGTSGSPVWTQVKGLTNFTPALSYTEQDQTTYDTGLWNGGNAITQVAFQVTGTVLRVTVSAVLDPGQEFLRTSALPVSSTVAPPQIQIRFYDLNGGPEAFSGTVTAKWEPQGGDATALEPVNFTLTGVGARTTISNPTTGSLVPVIVSALPSAAAVGTMVTLTGYFFTGTVSATVGGTTIVQRNVLNDNQLVIVMPAGSAGSAPFIVTNAAGASASFAYTRGA